MDFFICESPHCRGGNLPPVSYGWDLRWRAADSHPYRVPPLGSHRTLASLVQREVPRRGGGIAYSTDYTNIGGCFAIDNPPVSFAASPICTKGPLAH